MPPDRATTAASPTTKATKAIRYHTTNILLANKSPAPGYVLHKISMCSPKQNKNALVFLALPVQQKTVVTLTSGDKKGDYSYELLTAPLVGFTAKSFPSSIKKKKHLHPRPTKTPYTIMIDSLPTDGTTLLPTAKL